MQYFKAFIRVVKSISLNNEFNSFDSVNIIREPLIEAKDKNHVKKILLAKYPQFFPKDKIYQRETKDQAQFFYVVIYPLYNYELDQVKEGNWSCSSCGQIHENKYVSRPRKDPRLFGENILLCGSGEDTCYKNFLSKKHEGIEFPDDLNFVKHTSPIYIYKCTEKSSGKCYIGKTKNEPFFRWWNHLSKSQSPFGKYLRKSKLSEWCFEVIDELPYNTSNSEVLKVESRYILEFDSIKNGFNSVISSKK